MTVLEYVMKYNLKEFYCATKNYIILAHEHRSRRGNITTITQSFERLNLCTLEGWERYGSFNSFANKEVFKIENVETGGRPTLIVSFSKEDWEREIKEIFCEDKRDFNYRIIEERIRDH